MNAQINKLQSVIELVNIAVDIPHFAYPLYLNAPVPNVNNYAVVKYVHSENAGYDERTYRAKDDGSLIFITKGIHILTFDILFSQDGNEIIKFDNAFYRPDVQSVMKRHGLAFMSKEPTNLKNVNLEPNLKIYRGITCKFNVLHHQEIVINQMIDAEIDGSLVNK